MADTDKDLWRGRWLSSINELTSPDLQMKSWLNKANTNPHWSFVEFMAGYFDDLFIDDNYKDPLEKGWVTRQEYEAIKDWHKALDEYNPPKDDIYENAVILKDPKWLEILQAGVRARNELAKIVSESEKRVLTEEIDYLKFL